MKSWKRNPLLVTATVLLIAAGVLTLSFGAVADSNDSGIEGLQGPEFTIGLFLATSVGSDSELPTSASKVLNGFPYALSGYVTNIYNGTVHIWLAECSQVVLDLGFKPGDTIEIFCVKSQIEHLKVGDFASFFGFTVRGRLVRTDDMVLEAPFSY